MRMPNTKTLPDTGQLKVYLLLEGHVKEYAGVWFGAGRAVAVHCFSKGVLHGNEQ